jgi:hypothetical protein
MKRMKVVVLLAIILFLLLLALYFLEISIFLLYSRQNNEDHGEVTFSILGGIAHYTIEIPTIDLKNVEQGVKIESDSKLAKKNSYITTDKIQYWYERYESSLYQIKHFQANIRWLLSRITCEQLQWVTVVGTGDAAEAGVLTGLIWGVKNNLLGFISHYLRWQTTPQLDVQPVFQQAILQTYFEAKFTFKFGSILRFLWKMRVAGRTQQTSVNKDISFTG